MATGPSASEGTREKVLLEASSCHFLRSADAPEGRLCRASLTDKRLILREAFFDLRAAAEREGPSEIVLEVPLSSVTGVRSDLDAAEPSLLLDLAEGAPRASGKLALHFRDPGWHLGETSRGPELERWRETIDAARPRSGAPGHSPKPVPADPPPAAPAPAAENLLGGKYELGRQIGEGGMGIVYLGRDHSLERPVAIKRMRQELKTSLRDRNSFLREAKTSASLHHPFIVDIHEILQTEAGDVYLVFEFVDGETIAEILDAKVRIPPQQASWMLKDVCEALAYAHSRKVVHRDLKPSNIMITAQGHAKVMDFGIARIMKDTMSRLSTLDTKGTTPYMAPEQELGRFDARSDVFALGVTVYEMLVGELPFHGPNFFAQKEAMKWLPFAEAAPRVPRALAEAVERCLRFEPNERFQTVEEFSRAIGVANKP